MSQEGLKWIVGLDLRKHSQGAIAFAAWLSRNSVAKGGEHIIGIHVLEEAHLRAALRYHHLRELVEGAREAAESVIARTGADGRVAEIHILQGGTAERSLEAARVYHHADAMIIGRYAKRQSRSLLRLGRVARRLVRSLAMPVVVVPPDHDPASGAQGPIIAGIDLDEGADEVVAFASSMSERLQRPLVLAHVIAHPRDYGAHYLPEQSLEKMLHEHREEGELALSQWSAARGHAEAEKLVLTGSVTDELVTLASARQACLLVTGSRMLSKLERLILASVGTELAATAACPVAVVPPAG